MNVQISGVIMKRERPVGGRRIFPSVLEKLRQKVVFLSCLIGYRTKDNFIKMNTTE